MPVAVAMDEIMTLMHRARQSSASGGRKGKGALSPAVLLEMARQALPHFRRGQQQDSHELFVQLLDIVAGEDLRGREAAEENQREDAGAGAGAAAAAGDEGTLVAEVFGGDVCSTVRCLRCKTSTFTVEHSLSVSLEIPGALGGGSRRRPRKPVKSPDTVVNPYLALGDESASSDSEAEDPVSPPRLVAAETPQKMSRSQKQKAKRKAKKARRRQQAEPSIDKAVEKLHIDASAPQSTAPAVEPPVEEGTLNGLATAGENEAEGESGAGGGSRFIAGDLASYDPPAETSQTALNIAAASPTVSLRQCFEAYCAKERLRVEAGNGFLCDACATHATDTSDAWKRLALLRCPSVLVVHLKRLLCETKVTKRVTFEKELDVTSFCMTPPGVPPSIQYRLVAVIEHQGGAMHGHYVAYVDLGLQAATVAQGGEDAAKEDRPENDQDDAAKEDRPDSNQKEEVKEDVENKAGGEPASSPDAPAGAEHRSVGEPAQAVESQWYHISDSNAAPVDEARVLKAQAYMLFYRRAE
uniref:USP domain-containing protein n=1 Tax=Pinguiococcus pyrenoidosus TaxID=172671 RepID=A0A7R9YCQ3_9STRA|mmetsp:Transcript_306/g.1226  ORF Transcript_306/g.1226 Transcript_306/m.1226 type:complete len:526 (+) Transcript_306:196-1773(+)